MATSEKGEFGCEPLLKWAGGKRRLLCHILPRVPRRFGHYYEPFLGGGALFFSLLPTSATLGDSNPELINAYTQIRDDVESVIQRLRRLRNSEADYYRIRSAAPTTPAAKAARLIYLATLSLNGIYRQNLKGKFNVPYGHKTHVDPCDLPKLRKLSESLKGRKLVAGDFEQSVRNASKGDLVYFDPPYTVSHGNNGFIKYNAKIFSWEDQIRLATLAQRLRGRGVKVIISNADHPSIHDLYKEFECHVIERHSIMAASREFRRPVRECLFL